MRDIFIFAFLLGMLPAILRWPFLGIIGWCVVSYMNPHQLGWGMTHGIPFAMMIGATTIGAFILHNGPKALPVTPVTMLLLLFLGYTTLTTVFALAPEAAWAKWDRFFKIVLMTLLTVPLMANRERVHALVWTIVLCIGFYGVKGGVFTILQGGSARVWGPPSSAIEDNNHLSVALIMLLPLIRYLHLQTAEKWVRLGLLLSLPLIAAAILGTYSRTAFVTGLAALAWMLFKSRKKFAIISVGAFAAVLGLMFMPGIWMERMRTILHYDQDESVLGRFDAWAFGWRLAEMRPLLGGGFSPIDAPGLFMQLVPNATVPRAFHSNYFEVLGEHGIVGIVIFLSLFAAGFLACGRIIRDTRGQPQLTWMHDLASMLQVSMVAYAVGGLFLNLSLYDMYYHILVLPVMLRLILNGKAVPGLAAARAERETRAARVRHRPAPASGHDPSLARRPAP